MGDAKQQAIAWDSLQRLTKSMKMESISQLTFLVLSIRGVHFLRLGVRGSSLLAENANL